MNSTADDDRYRTPQRPSRATRRTRSGARGRTCGRAGRAQEHRDNYVRVVAEMDNLRKRTRPRDRLRASAMRVEKLAGDLLEARDSLELGIAAPPGDAAKQPDSRACRPRCG